MRRLRLPSKPSQRAIRNLLAFNAGSTTMEIAPVVKRGPQAEGETNKEVARWRNTKPNLVLERNKRRLATPPGMNAPIMLGWLCDGSPDWIGYESVTVTPNMVGRQVAVFVGLESKRRNGGVVSDDQQTFLDGLRDAGGICGVVRSFEDAEAARARWVEGMSRDER